MDNHRKVVTQYGFKYFQLLNGRFACTIKVNGELVYADDFPVSVGKTDSDIPQEPPDLEFIQMLKQDRS